MSDTFAWMCPYCGRAASLTNNSRSVDIHKFNHKNKEDSPLGILTQVIVCPHPECREYEIQANLYYASYQSNELGPCIGEWHLRPDSNAKTFPGYIPAPLLEDYTEACLVRDLSPKASATLSRRCLQGIIRDFWGISRNRLVDEINELKGKVDESTWKAIDAVRSVGNIGAHMEKDINVIVDVEPEEAQLLIGLIEILFKDWYVARHDREVHLNEIVALAAAKKAAAEQK